MGLQLRNRGNIDKRSLFYWSREYTKSLKAGKDYRELPDVIAIWRLQYLRRASPSCITRFIFSSWVYTLLQ